jgi:hypothetical protein
MELRGIVRLQLHVSDVDAVHEPFAHHVRRVRAEQERDEGDAPADVPLDGVRLEIVSRPAQGALRSAAGTSHATTSR